MPGSDGVSPAPAIGVRARLHRQLDPAAWFAPGLSPVNRIFTAVTLLAIALGISATEPTLVDGRQALFAAAERLFGLVFLGEYIARLWVAPEACPGRGAAAARVRFAVSPAGLIDLAVVAATLLAFVPIDASALRLLRLARILRFAKLGHTSRAFRHLVIAVRSRSAELWLTVGLAMTLLISAATALYLVEGTAQPEKFGSIPRAMWWAVVTLTTIGYGDVYPVTPLGKIIASVVAFGGIALIALPTGILAAAFSEEMRRERDGEGS